MLLCVDAAPAPRPFPVRAAGAALLPGLVFHGAGHYVAGHARTARRLLFMEAGGVGAIIVGIATLALTGASRHLTGPVFALPAAGAGLFAVSSLSDVYGVVAPDGGTGTALLAAATLEARVASRYVYDPTVRYGALLGPALDLRWHTLRFSPGAWVATSEQNHRLFLNAAYRPWGPRPGATAGDGSYAEVQLGGFHHRYGPEAFDLNGVDATAQARLDLARLGPTLAGSFAEAAFGLGVNFTHFRTGARATDGDDVLLFRFAYGLYLGRAGEVSLFYDHRHDDYAGGLKLTGLVSGVAGHVGAQGRWFFGDHWGLAAEAQVGSAYLAGLSVTYRSAP
jgi:hypothetical protein